MLSSSNSKTSLAFMSFLPDLGLPNIGEVFPDAWEFETIDIGTQFDAVEMGKKTECMLYGKRFDHTCITAHSHCELLGWTTELTPLRVLLPVNLVHILQSHQKVDYFSPTLLNPNKQRKFFHLLYLPVCRVRLDIVIHLYAWIYIHLLLYLLYLIVAVD